MSRPVSDVVFSPAVKALQERDGSRAAHAKRDEKGGWNHTVTDDLAAFIGRRDSFYLATASAEGQPTVQHRGGPKGFLKVLDEHTLAFADFAGNRQFISAGNLAENDRACIFLMDYAARRRIKVWGRARVVEDDARLLARLVDVNCPQHITPRYDQDQVADAVATLQERVAELEAERHALQGRLAAAGFDSRRELGK